MTTPSNSSSPPNDDDPCADASDRYHLKCRQIEPGAACWTGDALRVLSRDEIRDLPFPAYPRGKQVIAAELAELRRLARLRDDPAAIAGFFPDLDQKLGAAYPGPGFDPGFHTPSSPPTTPPGSTPPGDPRTPTTRRPLSAFLQLRPPPVGAVFNRLRRGEGDPVILTPRELARAFENETPGLYHRHALNFLILRRNWSPPRQSRVWAALDVALHSALLAAWHFKWDANCKTQSYRQRPVEADKRLDVLFDTVPNSTQSGDGPPRIFDPSLSDCDDANFSPGTPRHPAFPSGHSTYAGAGSELLTYFFPEYARELDDLADNIGMARLWGGIHWRSDHLAGLALGRAVACRIIAQLEQDGAGYNPAPPPCDYPPACGAACVPPRTPDKPASDPVRGGANSGV
jgi:membrane-associated phospholipid phosphatase